MKKTIGLLLLISMLFTALFTSCGGDYPPVESTREEAAVLFSIDVAGDSYEVKYELYRAFFLTHRNEVDGGDSSVWSGADKAEYVARINEIILPKIANIYATINLAEKIGVDFSSRDVEDTVDEFIKISVEGGVYNGEVVEGYGSYDDYLAALKAKNHNYSVQVLLFHYAIAQSAISEYYIGTLNEDNFTPDATLGRLEYTRDDVKAFYDSDECVRVLRAFIQYPEEDLVEDLVEAVEEAETKAASVRRKMLAADDTNAVSLVIINNTFVSHTEAFSGMVIGTYSLDANNYSELTEVAFELGVGEVSRVLKIMTGDENGYHILYRAEKSNSHFNDNYVSILDAYLNQKIGQMINERVVDLLSNVEYRSAYDSLDFGAISMN